jgi:hypothetical protein
VTDFWFDNRRRLFRPGPETSLLRDSCVDLSVGLQIWVSASSLSFDICSWSFGPLAALIITDDAKICVGAQEAPVMENISGVGATFPCDVCREEEAAHAAETQLLQSLTGAVGD